MLRGLGQQSEQLTWPALLPSGDGFLAAHIINCKKSEGNGKQAEYGFGEYSFKSRSQ